MSSFLEQLQWFIRPRHNHVVQFYPGKDVLIRCISEYVRTGLENNEFCLVVAKPEHLAALKAILEAKGYDTASKDFKYRCTLLDARKTLNSFMADTSPDWQLFHDTVAKHLHRGAAKSSYTRIYGEMVELLLEDNQPYAILELEKLWNRLAKEFDFSLYCGYPSTSFDGHQAKLVLEIQHQHAVAF